MRGPAVVDAPTLQHEQRCKLRIDEWDEQLGNLAAAAELPAIQLLKVTIEAQLALEELRIKFRQSDWAKTTVWGPLVIPAIGALAGALLGAWLKHS